MLRTSDCLCLKSPTKLLQQRCRCHSSACVNKPLIRLCSGPLFFNLSPHQLGFNIRLFGSSIGPFSQIYQSCLLTAYITLDHCCFADDIGAYDLMTLLLTPDILTDVATTGWDLSSVRVPTYAFIRHHLSHRSSSMSWITMSIYPNCDHQTKVRYRRASRSCCGTAAKPTAHRSFPSRSC